MGGFLQGLTKVLKTGFELTDRGMAYKQQRQSEEDALRRRRDDDIKFADMVQQRGALPVIGGMVDDGGTLRPADRKRTVKYRTADKEDVEFQLPTPEEQLARNAKLTMEAFQLGAPMRAQQGNEAVDLAGRSAGATARGRLSVEDEYDQAERERMGMAMPPGLMKALGIQPGAAAGSNPLALPWREGEGDAAAGRKFLPAELGQYARVAELFEPEAAAKPNPAHYETDASGNVTAIVQNADGSFRKESLGGVGKPQAAGSDGPTAYQQYQMGRNEQEDQRRAEERRQSSAQVWQTKVDGYQNQQDALASENEQLGAETVALGQQLKGDLKKVDRIKLESQLNQKKAKILANTTRFNAIQRQKKAADQQRRKLLGQEGEQSGGAIPSKYQGGDPLGGAAGGGVKVIDPRGVSHTFPSQAEANKFKALAGIP